MTAQVPFNPLITTNALGSFNVSSAGYIQGVQLDDPATRFALAGGILATSETIPMWGGVGIYEQVSGDSTIYLGNATAPLGNLGGQIGRATGLTGSKALTGFSVFNQSNAFVNTPQSPVPLAGSGMSVDFLRFGSGARISVQCDPILATYSAAQLITVALAWDFTNQLLVPYTGSINVSSGTYNGTTGLVTLTLAAPHGISAGDTVTVSGLTGTGSFAAANGTFTAAAGTTGSTLTYLIAASLTLTISTTGAVTTGSQLTGAQAVRLLDVNLGNSMTVVYNATTGFATWNRTGNTAIILI